MCENKYENLMQAELMAKNKIYYDKCVCPKLRTESKCGDFSGPEDITASGEGKQYPYFADRKNYAVYRNGERESWWMRSPHCGSDRGFCYYYKGSELNYCGAKQKFAVRFGFCI